MATSLKSPLPPLVTDPATATQLALAGWTSTVTVNPTQTALGIDLPSNTAGMVLLLQPSKVPLKPDGCADCGPPISCLMCPGSFQCLMGVQNDCSTCPPLRCVALSDTTTPSSSSETPSSTPTPTAAPSGSSASPKIIGSVLGAVGGVIIIALIVFFILWNRRQKKPKRQKSKIKRTRSPNLKRRDASGIIIDGNYLRERQDPMGCVREGHAELYEDKSSLKSLSTLFEDNSSTSSPKSPILIYTRRERTDRVRTPITHHGFEQEPDLIVPQPAQPVHQPRGLSAIFQLPKPISSRLSLGSLFSDTGRLSLSFKSSPSSSVKQESALPQFSTPSTARDSSLTMSSNASNIIPIAYMPGVLDYSSIADQYSAYQERKAARRREEKANSEHVEDVDYNDPYLSPDTSNRNSSKGSPLKKSPITDTNFGPLLPSVSPSPILQAPPLNTTQHIPNSSSLSTLFHAPSTPVPATSPLNVSGKFVSMLHESHSHQSSISSIATMSTASFERLWDQTGALVADESHIPPSPPPCMNSPETSRRSSNVHSSPLASPACSSVYSPHGESSSPLVSPTSTDMQFVSAPTSPNPRESVHSMLTTSTYLSSDAVSSQESLTSIQPSVIISRASTLTRNRIEGRTIDGVFPPRSSSLRRGKE